VGNVVWGRIFLLDFNGDLFHEVCFEFLFFGNFEFLMFSLSTLFLLKLFK